MTTSTPPETVADDAWTPLFSGQRTSVLLDPARGVARLKITRASEHNAIDPAFVHDLHTAVGHVVELAAESRAVLIEADGPNFTVGGDLKHFNGHLQRLADELVSMVGPFHETLAALAELPVPVVCAVQGAAAGGGLGLLWCADIVIAADDLKLITAFSKLGVSGDGGSSWYLPRMVGRLQALHLLLESPVLDAETAREYGLVTRVVPCAGLAAEAAETVRRLAAGPTLSLGLQRSLVREALGRNLREGLAAELEAMRFCGGTRDAAEGMAAFGEGRTPDFRRR